MIPESYKLFQQQIELEFTTQMEVNPNIVESREGTIKIIRFNKPKRKNAIDAKMCIHVTKILKEAANDDEISVMVLTGSGDYYSSGNDLVAASESNKQNLLLGPLQKYIEAFITFPKLLVAIVNGPAIGIAATTLALCDLVFASENSFFYTPFSKLGIVAEGCSTIMFPRLIGDRKAADMLLFNHKMSAKEALECGFVNDLYKPEEFNKVWDKVVEVSHLPQQSLTATKKLLRRPLQQELILANEKEIEALHKVWGSEQYRTSVSNFVNRPSKL